MQSDAAMLPGLKRLSSGGLNSTQAPFLTQWRNLGVLESNSENLCKMLNGELPESQLIRNRRQKDLCGI